MYIKIIAIKKTRIPEKSCRNPSAIWEPYCRARIAVTDRRIIFIKIAMGTAERKRKNFPSFECCEISANAALSARSEVSDLRPEHASTTSRVVFDK